MPDFVKKTTKNITPFDLLRQDGDYLFQHTKPNAPIQFPQSSLVAVILK